MVLDFRNIELFSYMIEKGAQIEKSAKAINRLFLSLMDIWDDAYFSLIEKMDLPIKECGGPALCSAAFNNHIVLAEYLLSAGVNINYREGYAVGFCCNDDELWKKARYSLSSFPNFFRM